MNLKNIYQFALTVALLFCSEIYLNAQTKDFGAPYLNYDAPIQYRSYGYLYDADFEFYKGYTIANNAWQQVSNYYMNPTRNRPLMLPTHTEKAKSSMMFQTVGDASQFIRFTHEQRLYKSVRWFADIRNYKYFITSQNNKDNPIIIKNQFQFASDSSKWELTAMLDYVKLRQQESWGIKRDSDLVDNEYFDLSSIDANSSGAQSENNELLARFDVAYALSDAVKMINNVKYQSNSWVYDDANTSLTTYPVIPDSILPASIHDTIGLLNLSNEIGFRHKLGEQFDYDVVGGYGYMEYMHNTDRQKFNNVYGALRFCYESEGVTSGLLARYDFQGANVGGTNVNLFYTYSTDTTDLKSQFEITYSKSNVAFNYKRFSTNYLSWVNDLNLSQNANASISLSSKKLRSAITAEYIGIKGYVYFNDSLQVVQDNVWYSGVRLQLQSNLPLGPLYLKSNLIVQKYFDADFLNYPELVYYGELGVNFKLFNQALKLKTGIGTFITSRYLANGINPLLRSEVVQNNTKIGGYPFVDYFIDARIKKTNIVLRISHLNDRYMLVNKSFMALGYPAAPMEIRLAVYWRFQD